MLEERVEIERARVGRPRDRREEAPRPWLGVKRREVDVQSVKVLAADEASDITQKRLG